MPQFRERAEGITAWVLEGAPEPAKVAQMLAEYDRAMVLWHAAQLVWSAEQIAAVERVANTLLSTEYEFPSAG